MIEIKPISELFEYEFIIPNYQRGYRWGKQEIEELLSDLFEYAQSISDENVKHSKFYCLQPVVVIQTEENKFELVDGQQRLTTVYLILQYLKDVRKLISSKDSDKLYKLDYVTRKESAPFLADGLFKQESNNYDKNIDFYYMFNAYNYIKNWFEDERNDGAKDSIIRILINSKLKSNVSVIWYQISEEDKSTPIELFTRLNQGKIPLTDAELIKALLLQSDKYPDDKKELYGKRLFEIASEWDDIEKKLNDERFWYFLTEKTNGFSSRIELIFELLAKKWNKDDDFCIKDNMKHFIYIVFDNHLKCLRKKDAETDFKPYDIAEIDSIWKEVTRIFNQFYYWYTNHKFYHYIGYLIAVSKTGLAELLDLSQKLGKDTFENELKAKIGESVKITGNDKTGKPKELSTIHYGENDDEIKIRRILLLFNVDAMIKNECEDSKFPFYLYKKQNITSIEHIHPQNPESFDKKEERAKDWLKVQIDELSHYKQNLQLSANDTEKEIDEQISGINEFLQEKYDENKFSEIFGKIIALSSKISRFEEKEKHTLYNLALIDKDTNSSLNNSFFNRKRNILKYETEKYVPICTIRAFEKYYSKSPQEMIFWTSEDRKAYFSAIDEMYTNYCSFTEK